MEHDSSQSKVTDQQRASGNSTDIETPVDRESNYAMSVVICTRNRRKNLNLTLDSLETQSWDRKWEVLVVDNGSRDNTSKIMVDRGKTFPVPLRVVREKTRGLSHARNLGLHEARGRAVVFIDDDVNCTGGWVAAHGRAFMEGNICGTAGRIVPLLPAGIRPWLRDILATDIGGPTSRYDFGSEPGRVGKLKLPLPFGANMGVRRRIALEVGGFRTDLGWGKRMLPSEEQEFFQRVRAARRGAILYLPTATVEHRIEPHRATFAYYKRWQRGYGRAQERIDEPPRDLEKYRERIAMLWELLQKHRLEARAARSCGDRAAEIEAIREIERAKGGILELIRLFFTRKFFWPIEKHTPE